MGKFGNDTSTLTNTELAQFFQTWLTGMFQAVLPWKLSKNIFKAMQCHLQKSIRE